MTKALNIAIAGIAGRMGRQLVAAAHAAGHTISGGSEQAKSPHLSVDIGTLAGLSPIGNTPKSDIPGAASNATVWIDFTAPAATLLAMEALTDTQVTSIIIGTTGFTPDQDAEIGKYASRFRIVKAGNFSLGVALLAHLTQLAAQKLGEGWDLEILETHHRHKVDAPSGTALMLGAAAASGRAAPLQTLRSAPYDGLQAKREAGKIGFAVRRSGGVIGEHEVTLTSETEQVTLSHKALDRRVFAEGAIKAAEWAAGQAEGLYSIYDVLEL